uniref:Heterokaryon incompatibility domain-containing protein n=1 Tax=Bionectria ochroleuca TaxID=29856 RepID=A0A8H7NPK3_BIOOC
MGLLFEDEIRFESDEVDTDAIETRVQQLMQNCDVSKGYCSRCGYLLSHWPALDSGSEWEYTVGQTYTTEEIEASSRCGCKMCGFLWSRLLVSDHLHRFRRIEAKLAALGRPGRCSLSIQNWGKSTSSQLIWLNLPGVEATHCNLPTADVVRALSYTLPITSNVWEELLDPVELAKSWISECKESHVDCRPLRKYEGPRRLIRISDDAVRLVESDSWDETPEYATLSYSWGSVPFTKLTRETFSSFLREIPFEILPKTFHDAIRLARELGLSYIWIDALCIIQDAENHEDWLKESGRMDCIYGGSQVTLSASSALDAFQGFFPTTPKYNGGFVARIQTDKTCRVQDFSTPEAYEEAVIGTHLGSRGWAFQEKLLSRRTLHIGDWGVFWECQSTANSQFVSDITAVRRLVLPENREWHWPQIVDIYSRTNLTLESDRLPALSGIAARQNTITGDQYLAGFWKKDIVSMLTWICTTWLAKRPSWRAPTWSWASIDGASSAPRIGEEMKPQARLLDGWAKTVSDNPFGAVLDGEITLACASLVRAKLDRTGIEDYRYGWWETSLERLGSKEFPHVIFPDFESRTFSVDLDCLDVEMQGKQEDVVLLPLFYGFSGTRTKELPERHKPDEPCSTLEAATSEDGKDETRTLTEKADNPEVEEDFDYLPNGECWRKERVIEGMVLRVVPGVVGHYTRLGQFSFDNYLDHARGRNFYEEMSSIVREKGAETARLGCRRTISSDEHLEQKYVISIK